MVIRKMQNNAIRKFPKNLNTMAKTSFVQMDETYKSAQEEIAENANSIDLEVEDAEFIEQP